LTQLKKSQRWLAEKLKLSPTFINLVVQGQRGLSSSDAQRTAAVLGIPADDLLRAAGHDVSAVDIAGLGAQIVTHGAGQIVVVTDPRFLDSALFLTMCAAQPFASVEIEFEVLPASWASVPDVLATQDEGIAFFNHRLIRDHPTHRKLMSWSDLCLYRGYAIIGRSSAFVRGSSVEDRLSAFRKLLEDHDERHKLEIVTIGLDTELVAEDWLQSVAPGERSKIRIFPSHDADFALEEFTKGELGDLFVGGLPQRVEAFENPACVEVISSEDDPLLFSYNSLLCTPQLHANRRNLLYLITNLWSEVVKRMYANKTFREHIAEECARVVSRFGVAPSRGTVSAERIVQMFTPQPEPGPETRFERRITSSEQLLSRDTELFISGPRDVSNAYLQIVGEAAYARAREHKLDPLAAKVIGDLVTVIREKEGVTGLSDEVSST
jgi:transcriptional regulator with XRE-family HTH domain